ncbi:hypothetical protein [Limnospira platensis]|uniref:hypothetical protein n=1 Tax=Limnospira platensis TaxID=118562 RepID=UPI00396C6715
MYGFVWEGEMATSLSTPTLPQQIIRKIAAFLLLPVLPEPSPHDYINIYNP